VTGFLNQVEFADGEVWVPTRQNMDEALLQQVLEPSAEEERLANLYVTKGLAALVEELKKY
jgi:DNA-binding TFAR19-related protein (PDSD5 family)